MQFQRYFVEKINSIRSFINKILKFNSTFLNYDSWHEILVTDHLIHVFNFLPSLATKYLLERKRKKEAEETFELKKTKQKAKKSKNKQTNKSKASTNRQIEAEVHWARDTSVTLATTCWRLIRWRSRTLRSLIETTKTVLHFYFNHDCQYLKETFLNLLLLR